MSETVLMAKKKRLKPKPIEVYREEAEADLQDKMVGAALEALRENPEITASEIARRLGISRQALYTYVPGGLSTLKQRLEGNG